ncbi:tripartite tricarboxylate transporter TctB family protein [Piscinibacter sp. XHJ-5]|uniref:tripartite tricarboxylate transporter TctB family protein n=1 Tax=Piscinibacter sp. XHJ-5 TaxID=3037797 RepID=UPI00245323A2|nr:tripartite tricarboxylate transporter TctB family protein [Piscinibacter sp. XHJ-5]
MLEPASEDRVVPPSTDRIDGPLWVVVGAAITVGALRTERLQSQGVEWFAAPGLLPGILGLLIAATGVLISLRIRRAKQVSVPETGEPGERRRIAMTMLLCLGFAAGLVGHGVPFGVAAILYLFGHIALLQWHERRRSGQVVRGLLVAAAVAVAAGLAVPFVFEQLFLVRLP